MTEQLPVTWRQLAQTHTEFVQWAAQHSGGLPDGPIRRDDYERLAGEFRSATERSDINGH